MRHLRWHEERFWGPRHVRIRADVHGPVQRVHGRCDLLCGRVPCRLPVARPPRPALERLRAFNLSQAWRPFVLKVVGDDTHGVGLPAGARVVGIRGPHPEARRSNHQTIISGPLRSRERQPPTDPLRRPALPSTGTPQCPVEAHGNTLQSLGALRVLPAPPPRSGCSLAVAVTLHYRCDPRVTNPRSRVARRNTGRARELDP